MSIHVIIAIVLVVCTVALLTPFVLSLRNSRDEDHRPEDDQA